MKLLRLIADWWARDLRVPRSRPEAWRGVPRDHFQKVNAHVFRDRAVGRLAATALTLGASMSLVTTYTTPGTFTGSSGWLCPAGVTSVKVECWGAGGGGGSWDQGTAGHGTGGGGGEYAMEPALAVTPGTYYSFTVGTAGAGAPSSVGSGYAGRSGTLSNFVGDSKTVTAHPGGGGDASVDAIGHGGTGSTNSTHYNGGSTSGSLGGGAGSAGSASAGNGTSTITGATAVTNGAAGGNGSTTAPAAGGNPGGGGGASTVSGINGAAGGNGQVQITFVTTAPNAPTSTSPASAAYADATTIIPFVATYNSTDAQTQNAYAMRIKVSGSSYQYWNAGSSSLGGSIMWNTITTSPGALFTLNLPANILTNGNVYNWAFASQESGANLQGAFSSDSTFTANAAPATSVATPTGSVVSTSPTVSWSNTLPGGTVQTQYQVIVESGSYGSTPGSGVQAWTSGLVTSASTSVMVGTALGVTTTYRAFVQVTETGGLTGTWAYSTFTVIGNVPAAATITATAVNDVTSGLPEIQLTVQANDNELTANQSSLESDATTGWAAGSNTTLAASSTWSQDGTYSLRLTATSSGAVTATTPTGTGGVPVVGGQLVRALASFHSPSTARACTVAIAFYNSSGSLISTSTGTAVNSTTTGNGGQPVEYANAPVNASYMTLVISAAGLSSSEAIYADCLLLGPGTTPAWTVGGLVGSTSLIITRSDGVEVRGAGWQAPADVPPNQSMVIYDVETETGIAYTYTATVTAVSGGNVVASMSTSNAATVTVTQWDIIDPTDITSGTQIDWAGDTRTFDQPEDQGVFNAFQRSSSIVVRGTMHAPTPTQLVLQFGADEDVAWQAFQTLRQKRVTLQLRGDMPGDFFYVVLGPSQPIITNRTSSRLSSPSRNLTIAVTVVDRP